MRERGPDLRDAPGLLVDAFRNFSELMQDEISLAKAEMKQSVSKARTGLILILAALLLSLVALHVLADALVAFVAASGLSTGLAALLVAGGLLILAGGLALAAKSRLSPEKLAPKRSLANVQRDLETLKEPRHA